ncbi:A-factor biosynthesis hotdog protein [Nocardia mexicana]|uniref:A-factor biosynthesis hotdog protein n=2 Tax=Nocardia mexicana TaxID=279262 RepID=A0A370GNF5_9NOCA|nr:A-factor biosynthesis hotdog protein [Nocardia mexicana]
MAVSEYIAPVTGQRPLSFRRTVDRSLVHRSSIAEVFAVDVAELDERRCVVGAQLPVAHRYYSDSTMRRPRYDPLLLLECSRQAAILSSHLLLGLPLESAMAVSAFKLDVSDPDAMLIGPNPGELAIETTLFGTPNRRGRIRKASAEQQLHLDGIHIGTHEINAMIVSGSENKTLRDFHRGTPPPSTADYVGARGGDRVPPHRVGRWDGRNVVLADLHRRGSGATATVAPDFGNRALFDHDYDHLPGMVLTEAARQLALIVLDDDTEQGLEGHAAVGIAAAFERYAELDQPLTAAAVVRDATGPGAVRLQVTFLQGDSTVAEVSLEFVALTGEL